MRLAVNGRTVPTCSSRSVSTAPWPPESRSDSIPLATSDTMWLLHLNWSRCRRKSRSNEAMSGSFLVAPDSSPAIDSLGRIQLRMKLPNLEQSFSATCQSIGRGGGGRGGISMPSIKKTRVQ